MGPPAVVSGPSSAKVCTPWRKRLVTPLVVITNTSCYNDTGMGLVERSCKLNCVLFSEGCVVCLACGIFTALTYNKSPSLQDEYFDYSFFLAWSSGGAYLLAGSFICRAGRVWFVWAVIHAAAEEWFTKISGFGLGLFTPRQLISAYDNGAGPLRY